MRWRAGSGGGAPSCAGRRHRRRRGLGARRSAAGPCRHPGAKRLAPLSHWAEPCCRQPSELHSLPRGSTTPLLRHRVRCARYIWTSPPSTSTALCPDRSRSTLRWGAWRPRRHAACPQSSAGATSGPATLKAEPAHCPGSPSEIRLAAKLRWLSRPQVPRLIGAPAFLRGLPQAVQLELRQRAPL